MSSMILENDVHLRIETEQPAWHRTEIPLKVECLTRSQELLKVTDRVVPRPIQYGIIKDGQKVWQRDNENKAYVRENSGLLMMYANKGYTHIQDEEIISAIMEGMEKAGQIAPLVYAGTLGNQKQGFFRFRTNNPNVIHGRTFLPQFTFCTFKASQDVLHGFNHVVDTVCKNTINLALTQANFDLKKKQTKFARDTFIPLIINTIEDQYKTTDQFMADMEVLGDIPMTSEQATRILAYYESANHKSLTKREYNKVVNQEELFRQGIGNKGKTALDLYNGVTEFYSAGQGTGGKTVSIDQKWSSSEFGGGMSKKEKFFKLIHNDGGEITDTMLDVLADSGEAIIKNTPAEITGTPTKVHFAGIKVGGTEEGWQ